MNLTATRIGPLTVFVSTLLAFSFVMVAGVTSVRAGNPFTGLSIALAAGWPVATLTGVYTVLAGRPGWALLGSRRAGMKLMGWAFLGLIAAGVFAAVGASL